MPEIQAFRAIRYNLGHVGSLSDVVAPPYDVIGPRAPGRALPQAPVQRRPPDPQPDRARRRRRGNNRYTRAKRFLKDWLAEGVLFTEADPAIYVYHQEFTPRGRTYTRRGFMARMRLSRFGEGQVFPHEETCRARRSTG